MPKVKIPRKSTFVDMTAMTDVAFLLLTFFMLATKFKPEEAVVVETPTSTSDVQLPDAGIMVITLDSAGKAYIGIDNQMKREDLIKNMGAKYSVSFTDNEIKSFSLIPNIGIPMNQLKQYLSLNEEQRKKFVQEGIPKDSAKNELYDWILESRRVVPKISIAIKGDKQSKYPKFDEVIKTLQKQDIYSYSFITTMEEGK